MQKLAVGMAKAELGNCKSGGDAIGLGVMALVLHRWGGRWIWEEMVNVRPVQKLISLWEFRHLLTDFWTLL